MAKLIFNYTTMGKSKSIAAPSCRDKYLKKGKNVLMMKLEENNDETSKSPYVTFKKNADLSDIFYNELEKQKIDIVIVDECQFCTKSQIDQLRDISESVPVFCFGLKTNFKGELFEGSKRLLEISDEISEIKNICDCGKKAIMNGRFKNGLLEIEGEEIVIGEEQYKGLCYNCFKREQKKTKVYKKILKYLEIFKNLENAGTWSTDTSRDSLVLERPFVIYDEQVNSFIEDFKEFDIKNPQKILIIGDNIKSLQKISMKNKDFDYMMTLISCVLRMEKNKPGMLKTLIENDIMTKWLKQIKKTVDHIEN